MRRLIVVAIILLCAGMASAQTGSDTDLLTQRPDSDGPPTRVEVQVFVADVSAIDDVKQEFSADIYLKVTWKDPRLAGPTTRKMDVQEIWYPNLTVVNERSMEEMLAKFVTVDQEGLVSYVQRKQGTLSARMDLREFPYDRQILEIGFVGLELTPDEIELVPGNEMTQGYGDYSISGWQVAMLPTVVQPIYLPATGENLVHLAFQIDAVREVGYYVWVMFIPLIFIVLMAWMVFWIDPSLLPPQVSLSTAAVFSLIAFRFSMRMSLPTVSYMTRMDHFVLGCTVLVFLALGQAVMTGRLAKQGREDLARTMDRWGRWIYLGSFAVIVMLFS